MNIVTKFQVFIFKNDEVRGRGRNFPPPPPTWNKLDRRQRGIGLMKVYHWYTFNCFDISMYFFLIHFIIIFLINKWNIYKILTHTTQINNRAFTFWLLLLVYIFRYRTDLVQSEQHQIWIKNRYYKAFVLGASKW